jgi:hypothetical protein
MTCFHVTFHPASGRAPLTVEADRYEKQGLHWVFWTSHTLMNRVREVVALRVPVDGVAGIRED